MKNPLSKEFLYSLGLDSILGGYSGTLLIIFGILLIVFLPLGLAGLVWYLVYKKIYLPYLIAKGAKKS